MANLNGVDIQKGKIGANRLSGNDAVSGFVFFNTNPAVFPETLDVNVPYSVFNSKDVENLGITQSFDTENSVLLHRHFSEFFAMAGEGTPLHFILSGDLFSDQNSQLGKTLMAHAKGEMRQLGIINSRGTDEAPLTMLDGLPEQVVNWITTAQGLYDWSYDNNMPLQVLLEGYNFGGTAAAAANLRDLEDLQATKVSLIIGQDYGFAQELPEALRKFADVGTALGVLSKAKVYENIGDNGQFNLTEATKGRWLEAGISSHQSNTEAYSDLQTLETKGYIFGVEYPGLAGVRLNNDHVCAAIIVDSDDSMNEHTIAYGRVADKAVRELRSAYLPKVKTTWTVDRTTGKLTKGTLVALEDVGDNVFEDMFKRGEITYGKAYVDADSDLLVERVLRLSYVIIPKGTIGEIKGTINLKTRD
jgi:hypothetical protein